MGDATSLEAAFRPAGRPGMMSSRIKPGPIFSLTLLSALLAGAAAPGRPSCQGPAQDDVALVEYLKSHWQSPEDYVLSKFRDHDLVFLGEGHKFRHDVELVHNLIPLLYRIGITDLAVEFGCSERQAEADRLVVAETYNEDLARRIAFHWAPYWPYKEYVDIYRKAWELNRTLHPAAPKFRIVHLDYRVNWPLVRESMTSGIRRSVFFRGERDDYMAGVVLDEFVRKGKKALIYAGGLHTLTRFREPGHDFQAGGVRAPGPVRMGNIVHEKIGPRVFYIQLHFPWPARAKAGSYGSPVDGAIDRALAGFEDKRVGFDVAGTPFGRLRDTSSTFSAADAGFRLEALCDGYVYQKAFGEYQGVTVDWKYVTKENFREACQRQPNPNLRRYFKSPYHYLKTMELEADFGLRFPGLK